MMGLELPNGQPVTRDSKPKMFLGENEAHRASFEGIIDVRVYRDAIEATGKCEHCGSKVVQVLRFPTHMQGRPEYAQAAREALPIIIRANHFCPTTQAGKTVLDDWLRQIDVNPAHI